MKKETMKKEAVKRMKMLKMSKEVIRQFEEEDVLNLSESIGYLYWLDNEQKEIVRKFEEKFGFIVYTAIHDYTDFGEMLSLLYVSPYSSEWKQDRQDIEEGYALVYVVNLSMPDCSEFGSIGIRPSIGGLIRVA